MSFSVNLHQKIAFSKYFRYKTTDSPHIFMPGCSLLSLGYENVLPLYSILQRAYGDMALATYCCGKPSKYINHGRDFLPRISKLHDDLDKTIFTACPNCYNTLNTQGFQVISIWNIIDTFMLDSDIIQSKLRLSLHDPCTAKKMTQDHDAVRSILQKCKVDILEFPKCRERATCCGKINMTMALDKVKGNQILQSRLKTRENDHIISYCASCTESFDIKGITSYHISDLFCHKKSTYSSTNRFMCVKRIHRTHRIK